MITSNQNPKIKRFRRLLADRRYRQREAAYVVEGTRWLRELVQAAPPPELVLVGASWQQEKTNAALLDELDAPIALASDDVLAATSATETPSGVMAVLPITKMPLPDRPSLLLILDRVADPGNLGTMIRTAAAAGAGGVLLSPGCVDPYNPKAVRATMGALLRLPVLSLTWAEITEVTSGMTVWAAAASGTVIYSDVDWREPAALVIGSEAGGIGSEALALGQRRIAIPMAGQTESLNAAAAAAVVLFEARRQRRAV
jgi:TrmH family RNA methyltransferase